MDSEKLTRGLPAIQQGRERRLGFPKIPPRFWLWTFTILTAWAIIYWKYSQEKLDHARNELLAKQRDVFAELGPRFEPLRERIERWITEGAAAYAGDFVAPDASSSTFRSKPSVYLRLFIDDAKDPKILRKAALISLRDGFSSCFTRASNPDPWSGTECKLNRDCPAGQHCNETYHCTVPAQPYNLRVFYRAAHIFSDDWVKTVREANSDMRVRLLEHDFEATIKDDVPLAIDLLTRAQTITVVLDEPAENPSTVPDAGGLMESLQAVEHPVRIFIHDLQHQDRLFLRLRTSATAQIGATSPDAKTMWAMRRQANSCAVALAVRRALGDQDAL